MERRELMKTEQIFWTVTFPVYDISWGKYLLIIGSGLEDDLWKTERNSTFNNLMRLEKQKLKLVTGSAARILRIHDPRDKEGVEKWSWNPVSFKAFAESINNIRYQCKKPRKEGLKRKVEFYSVHYYGDRNLRIGNQNLRGPRIYSREGNGTPLQYSCLENPMDRGAWWAAVHGVTKSRTRLSDFTFTFHFHALEKEMATHSSVLAWRIPGMTEPGGLPSMGSHRVGHDWSNLAAAAAAAAGYTPGFRFVSLEGWEQTKDR